MVRKRRTHMRSGDYFYDFTRSLKKTLEPIHNRRISDRELTDRLARFIDEENLTKIIISRDRKSVV